MIGRSLLLEECRLRVVCLPPILPLVLQARWILFWNGHGSSAWEATDPAANFLVGIGCSVVPGGFGIPYGEEIQGENPYRTAWPAKPEIDGLPDNVLIECMDRIKHSGHNCASALRPQLAGAGPHRIEYIRLNAQQMGGESRVTAPTVAKCPRRALRDAPATPEIGLCQPVGEGTENVPSPNPCGTRGVRESFPGKRVDAGRAATQRADQAPRPRNVLETSEKRQVPPAPSTP